MNTLAKQITAITLCVLVAFGIAGYFLYSMATASDSSSEENLSGNFGTAYGIHDITRVNEESLDGLPSVTASFFVDTEFSDPAAALQYVGEFMSTNTDETLTNLVVKSDADNDKKFSFNFYASSPTDYQDGSFATSADAFNRAYENEYPDLTVNSQPTHNGLRTIDVDVKLIASSDTASVSPTGVDIKQGWNTLVGSFEGLKTDGSRYTLKVATGGDAKQTGVSGFYYDEDSYQALTNLNERVWATLGQYSVGQSFAGLNPKSVTYEIAQGKPGAASNDTTFDIVLAGEQPADQAAIDKTLNSFRSAVSDSENVMFFWSNITSIRYENNPNPVLLQFPSNMEW